MRQAQISAQREGRRIQPHLAVAVPGRRRRGARRGRRPAPTRPTKPVQACGRRSTVFRGLGWAPGRAGRHRLARPGADQSEARRSGRGRAPVVEHLLSGLARIAARVRSSRPPASTKAAARGAGGRPGGTARDDRERLEGNPTRPSEVRRDLDACRPARPARPGHRTRRGVRRVIQILSRRTQNSRASIGAAAWRRSSSRAWPSASCAATCPRASGQASRCARHGALVAGAKEMWRVRGAAQAVLKAVHDAQGGCHPLHRRAAHGGGRGGGRGGHGREQPAQARWRGELHCIRDARRASRPYIEKDAALERDGSSRSWWTSRRGGHDHLAGSGSATRGITASASRTPALVGGRRAVQPLHRHAADKAIDSSTRPGGAAPDRDRFDAAELDEITRRTCSSRSSGRPEEGDRRGVPRPLGEARGGTDSAAGQAGTLREQWESREGRDRGTRQPGAASRR